MDVAHDILDFADVDRGAAYAARNAKERPGSIVATSPAPKLLRERVKMSRTGMHEFTNELYQA